MPRSSRRFAWLSLGALLALVLSLALSVRSSTEEQDVARRTADAPRESAESGSAARLADVEETVAPVTDEFAAVRRGEEDRSSLDGSWVLEFELSSPSVGRVPLVVLDRPAGTLRPEDVQALDGGRFRVPVAITAAELKQATIFVALDRVAMEARAGEAIRQESVHEHTVLGSLLAADARWVAADSVLDAGVVELRPPRPAGALIIEDDAPRPREFTVEFFRSVPQDDDPLAGLLGDEFDPNLPQARAPFGRATHRLLGTDRRVVLLTFARAEAWELSANSIELREIRALESPPQSPGEPDWVRRRRIGNDIVLGIPPAAMSSIELWVDLTQLTDARRILVREAELEAAYTLNSEQLRARIRDVGRTSLGISEKLATTKHHGPISLGSIPLDAKRRYAIEVWSGPDSGDGCAMLRTELVDLQIGTQKVTLR